MQDTEEYRLPNLRQYIGIEFVDRGRDPVRDGGVDCWGLARMVGREFGYDFPDFFVSCDDESGVGAIMWSETDDKPRWERLDGPEPGAVVLFSTSQAYPQLMTHAGVCISDKEFIHTYRAHKSAKCRLKNPMFKDIIGGYWRWRG